MPTTCPHEKEGRSPMAVLAVARRQTCRSDCTMRAITRMLLLSVCGWCAGEPLASAMARRRDAAHAYASTFAREYEPYVYAAVPLHAPVPVLHVLSPAPLSTPPHHALKPRPYTSSVRHTPFTGPYSDPRPYTESNAYVDSWPYAESRPIPESRPYAQSRPHAEVRPYVESHPYVESLPFGSSRPYLDAVEYAGSEYGRAAHLKLGRPSSSAEFDSYALQAFQVAPARVTVPHQAAALEADAPFSSQEAAPTVLYARPSLSGGYTYRPVANTKSPSKKAPSSKEQPVIVKIHKHKIIKS